MIQDFKEDYYSPIPIVRFYFNRIISTILSMLEDIPQESLILDFGCGRQYFKKVSGFKNVVGYDVVPGFTDIKNYRGLKPDVILCNHSLEHLAVNELRNVLRDFKAMAPKFIITGIPTENIISKVCAAIGRPHGYFEHKAKINTIHEELDKNFTLLRRKNIMTLTVVSKYG